MINENFKEAKLREAEIKERGETKLFYLKPEKEKINKPEK